MEQATAAAGFATVIPSDKAEGEDEDNEWTTVSRKSGRSGKSKRAP
jgi:hypothetical protein